MRFGVFAGDRISRIGIDYVILTFPRAAYNLEPLQRFAREVMPVFSSPGAAD